jgi:hypothetical protein
MHGLDARVVSEQNAAYDIQSNADGTSYLTDCGVDAHVERHVLRCKTY